MVHLDLLSCFWFQTHRFRQLDLEFTFAYFNSGQSRKNFIAEYPDGSFKEFLKDKNIDELWRQLENDYSKLMQIGAQIVPIGHLHYPPEFYQLKNPPTCFSYLGIMPKIDQPRLAIVGSRKLLSDHRNWCDMHLLDFLKSHKNLFVVSGAAIGADQCAHIASIKVNSPSLAILPSGLANFYPSNFKHFQESILQNQGSILSSYGPDQHIFPQHFSYRNELIAAISDAVFILQAARLSGSSMTARLALQLGREIAVLPNSAQCTANLANLDLLYDGAQMLRDSSDLKVFYDQFFLKRQMLNKQKNILLAQTPSQTGMNS